MTKELFITQLFACSSTQEAFDYFSSNTEFPAGSITVIDCINVLYSNEMRTKSWQQMDNFIPSSMHLHKLIMRDLIDIGYLGVGFLVGVLFSTIYSLMVCDECKYRDDERSL